MAWVRFHEPFRWVPPGERRVTIRYPVGEFSVTQACAKAAIAEGKGKAIKTPNRAKKTP